MITKDKFYRNLVILLGTCMFSAAASMMASAKTAAAAQTQEMETQDTQAQETEAQGTEVRGTEAQEMETKAASAAEDIAENNAETVTLPERTPTLWVAGDSTAAEFSDNYYYPRYGWGTQLYRYFHDINIKNLAVSGTSSKSYADTEAYRILMDSIQDGDYLLIGFGHNDEKAESARYTNPNGSIGTEGSTQYYLYQNFIKPVKEKNAVPILVTPIVRRDAGNNYTGTSGHITSAQTTIEGTFEGGNYAKAIKAAGSGKLTPVLDLTGRTRDLYEQKGAQGIRFHHAYSSPSENSIDNTHTSMLGAAYNAYLIADELKKTNCFLKNYVIEPLQEPDPSILEPNPNYQWKTFQAPSSDSAHWSNAGEWRATVFGDVDQYEYLNDIYFHFEPYEDGSMRIAAGRQGGTGSDIVGASVGKIAAQTDGIAMYYQQLPSNRNFTLSADVTITSMDANNQASFGLMVRDDIYLDYVTNETLGDYVAAGPLMMGSSDPWNCFARKSGELIRGGVTKQKYLAGNTVHLEIRKNSDGYSCTYGSNEPISAGFDFPLTQIDPEHVYVGMFAARSVDVAFSNISLIME